MKKSILKLFSLATLSSLLLVQPNVAFAMKPRKCEVPPVRKANENRVTRQIHNISIIRAFLLASGGHNNYYDELVRSYSDRVIGFSARGFSSREELAVSVISACAINRIERAVTVGRGNRAIPGIGLPTGFHTTSQFLAAAASAVSFLYTNNRHSISPRYYSNVVKDLLDRIIM